MSDQSTTVDAGNEWPVYDQDVLEPGTSVGRWKITRLIASGGHGAVYHADSTETGAVGAIKILHRNLSPVPRMVERFTREVQLILRLEHPNIIRILDIGAFAEGIPYYVMEYLQGKTLRTLLDEVGRLEPADLLAIVEPICQALESAHGQGIVHRDVKASNIMLTSSTPRQVKLLDFGVAKLLTPEEGGGGLTSVGRLVGTPSAMAPEQILGTEIDSRADIYALGALLHLLLTGRQPFQAANLHDLAQLHLEAPPPRPSERVPISTAFDPIVTRAMDKRKQNRYPTAGAFLEALQQAVLGSTNAAPSSADRQAVGLFVDIRPRDSSFLADQALDEATMRALEHTEERMRQAGLSMAMSTSNTLLGVRLLEDEPNHDRALRRHVFFLAQSLRNTLAEEPLLHVNATLHVDQVTVREVKNGPPEITSGVIARTESWAPMAEVEGICATPEFLGGMEELVLELGQAGLFVVTGPEEIVACA